MGVPPPPSAETARDAILPDVLERGLALVIVGMAASAESARRRAYYAHPGNKFWMTLHAVGLTPRRLAPEEYPALPSFGIGLTDVCKTQSGADHELDHANHDPRAVRRKIVRYAPLYAAFNSKTAARLVLGGAVGYGLQEPRLGSTRLFVLPSTSGRAGAYWDVEHWRHLARLVRRR